MTPLELKKMKLELIKVSAAKAELEFRVDERMDDIERIKASIVIQEEKEIDLQIKISEAQKASN